MISVGKGIWRFSSFSVEKQMEFNGWLLEDDKQSVLVDPVPLSAADRVELSGLRKPSLIVVTNKDHRRAAPELAAELNVPLAIHALDAPLFEASIDRQFQHGDRLGMLEAVHLPDQKSPGECALWWPAERALILGDALIGKPAGTLSLPPLVKLPDLPRALTGLRRLLELGPIDRLLVGDGEPILSDARAVLAAMLAEAKNLPPPAQAVRGC